ncbi:MAG: glycerol-3-phosphate 1-O-acyltransferase PlsY [Bacteroidales bacterium]|nr:glycerol-3-phosphate 1-O-acyltransferase PlsY [Bacteroidales bacterium]
MHQFIEISGILISYLLGSVPFAVLIGKVFYNTDVRKQGSGNSGATNTLRVLGVKAGLTVLILDIFKGYASVKLAYVFTIYDPSSEEFANFQVMYAFAALMGHIFPAYIKFKGGKGVATLTGILLALNPALALTCIIIFLAIFLFTKYVSLSSIITAILYPILAIIIFKAEFVSLIFFSLLVAVIVPLTHYKNIERLIKGDESKIDFRKNKSTSANNNK